MKKLTYHSLLITLVTVMILTLTACQTTQPRSGQSISIQTGRVVQAQPVNMRSQVPAAAAIGGIVGYVTTSSRHSSSRRARNTIIGAATGGLIAGATEGSLTGMSYTVEVASGARIQVVTDQTDIKIGDCVNVEQAGTGNANVRRVSPAMCEAVAENNLDQDIQNEMSEYAERCLAAKDRLVEAETESEIEAAIRRVKILCDD